MYIFTKTYWKRCWLWIVSLGAANNKIVPMYDAIGLSSNGEIPFMQQSAILYEETHHLCIEAVGPRGKLTMMGWGNIPGAQEINPEKPFQQGAYFTDYDASQVHIAIGGQVEVLSYDALKSQIRLSYEFEMLLTNDAFELSEDKAFSIKGELDVPEVAYELYKKPVDEDVKEKLIK